VLQFLWLLNIQLKQDNTFMHKHWLKSAYWFEW